MSVNLNHCLRLKYESSIHNIAFSSEKVISSESGQKYAQIKQTWFQNRGWTFSLEEALLEIMDWYFGKKWWFETKMS